MEKDEFIIRGNDEFISLYNSAIAVDAKNKFSGLVESFFKRKISLEFQQVDFIDAFNKIGEKYYLQEMLIQVREMGFMHFSGCKFPSNVIFDCGKKKVLTTFKNCDFGSIYEYSLKGYSALTIRNIQVDDSIFFRRLPILENCIINKIYLSNISTQEECEEILIKDCKEITEFSISTLEIKHVTILECIFQQASIRAKNFGGQLKLDDNLNVDELSIELNSVKKFNLRGQKSEKGEGQKHSEISIEAKDIGSTFIWGADDVGQPPILGPFIS